MKKLGLVTLVVFAVSFTGAPVAWAKTCPKKYAQVKALVEKGGNYDTLKKAIECAEEGIQLHNNGKHDDSVKKLDQCLKMLGG